MEVGVCRRVEGVSCPFEGGEVPTLVDLVPQLGSSIAKTVVVEVGYNDPAELFAGEVEDAMHVLLDVGVTRVLWVNMREAEGQYPAMNAALVSATQRYPQLTVIDWNGYSSSHADWFQSDGMHLLDGGGQGLATLLHDALVNLVLTPAPPVAVYPVPAPPAPPLVLPPTTLPAARVGRPYAAQLVATGGTAPYRWRSTSGPLPGGLHLLADGRLTGTPRRLARVAITFRATDARGQTATRQFGLSVVKERSGSGAADRR
jgi:Putative Ig domain